MPDVLIRRCTIRLVRRGGWSWGAEPAKWLVAALQSLPAVVAERLEQRLGTETEDVEFSEPIVIRIPIRLADLAPPSGGSEQALSSFRLTSDAVLKQRLEEALDACFGVDDTAVPPSTPLSEGRLTTTATVADAPLKLEELLRIWLEAGDLRERLALIDNPVIELWHDRILASSVKPPAGSGEWLAGAAAEALSDYGPKPTRPEGIRRFRLWLALRLAAQAEAPLDATDVRAAVDAAAPLDPPVHDATPIRHQPSRSGRDRNPDHRGATARRSSAPARALESFETQVPSVLPFLAASCLARIGYFDALTALLEPLEAFADTPLYGAALACKFLDPPERGWRREKVARAASAFAGSATTIAESGIQRFADRVGGYLSPLDATLARALVQGHVPGRPLLLTSARPGCVLFEVDGLFPFAFSGSFSGLLPLLRQWPDPPLLLIPVGTASRSLLREIDESGFRFLTDAVPTRGESWRPLRHRNRPALWTNDRMAPAHRMADFAPGLERDDAATRTWQEIGERRPAAPLAERLSFDESLTLAAVNGLAAIAWGLWPDDAETGPLLALHRFSDFDGVVRFEPDRVRVALPLGRRFFDLERKGFLEPVSGLPWLGGRRLEFGRG